jgi:hypothetical protein
MSSKCLLGLAVAAAFMVIPQVRASQLPPQWFLGKWGCTMNATPITMVGMIGDETYVFRNMMRGVRVEMQVIAHTPTTVSMEDEAGNIFRLRSQIRALGPKMTGTAMVDGMPSSLACFKNSRFLVPPDTRVDSLSVPID